MKPSAKSATNSPVAASDAPPAGVTDELRAIDVAPLERLLEVRKEEAQLEEFRARADQMKDNVQDVVWRRVVSDYTTRVAALEEQATPLKTQVRAEYQKLRALLDRTKALNETADLEKSELEFRHAVGELSKKQLDERLKSPLDVLERCRIDLAAIDEQKARFLSAFASEAELEAPVPAPTPRREPVAAPPAPAPPAAAAPELEADVTMFVATPLAAEDADAATALAPNPLMAESDATILAKNPLPVTEPLAAPMPVPESDATSVVSADQIAAMSKGPAPMPPPSAPKPSAGESVDKTFMLPAAGLLINSETATPREYRLAAMNYLGRSDDSHVIIARPGVSRKHALIVVGTGGFTIKDLDSQNGTYVNGQRVTDQPLTDGDQIVIGDTQITFRMPWPGGGRSRA